MLSSLSSTALSILAPHLSSTVHLQATSAGCSAQHIPTSKVNDVSSLCVNNKTLAIQWCVYADLMHVLWEADVAVFKAHITTGPSDKVLDLFWIYDNKKELPENHR